MAINKIVFGNETLLDLTGDTISADKLLEGYTAHNASGETIIGTVNVQDGFSPTIVVSTETDIEYALDITDVNGTFETPNLKGIDGQDGYSPIITVDTNTDTNYILEVTDVNGSYTTPNLKGIDGLDGATAIQADSVEEALTLSENDPNNLYWGI